MQNEKHQHSGSMLWILIGLILMIYGVLIFGTGLYHTLTKHPFHTALAYIHPDILWGSVMFIAGLLFYVFNRKTKQKS